MKNNTSSNLQKLIKLQQEALAIYAIHFKAFIPHLHIKKKDRKKINQILDDLFKEKTLIIKKLNNIKKRKNNDYQ